MKLYVQNMNSNTIKVVLVLVFLGACSPKSSNINGSKSKTRGTTEDTVLTGEMRVIDPTDKPKGIVTKEF